MRLLGEVIDLRTVKISDASFIVRLRNNKKLKTYISQTNNSIVDQENWIRNYEDREGKEEYYFIVESKDGTPYGTVRLYNIDKNKCTWGSFILDPARPEGTSSDVMKLSINFAFEKLDLKEVELEVNKNNTKAVHIYKKFGFKNVKEDGDTFFMKYFRNDKA